MSADSHQKTVAKCLTVCVSGSTGYCELDSRLTLRDVDRLVFGGVNAVCVSISVSHSHAVVMVE